MNVQLPNGDVVSFPDGMPSADVNSAIEQHMGQSSQPADSISTIGNDADKRMLSAAQNPSLLHTAGQAAGFAGDVIGEGVKAITPQPYIDASHELAGKIDNTSVGQKLGDTLLAGTNAVDSVKQNYPKTAQAIGDLLNIGSLGAGGDTAGAIEGTGAKLGLGDALYASGKGTQDAAHQQYVQNLILPKETPTVKADMATRTQQINGRNVYQPSPQEQQISSTVASVPGLNSGNSYVKNLNLIQDANRSEAEALKSRLIQNDAPIPDDVIQNTLATVHQNISNNPYISGVDASKAASNVVNKALDIITSKPQTASSMLDARKELDAWVSSQKGEKAFNPALDSPITTAVQQVRQAMNGMVADAVPSADVKASLQKQSNLYQAADNIAPKAAGEYPTKLGRTIQKYAPKNLNEGAKDAALLYGIKEIAPHIPPSALAAGLVSYGLYKGVTSPSTRIGLGKALGVSDAVR